MIEQKIMTVEGGRISKLFGPSKIASEKPDTGVKILSKPAYFVIRDCARVTRQYLPILVYGSLNNPIEALKGAFTVAEVKEFVNRSESLLETRQLLCLMLFDANRKLETISPFSIDVDEEAENVYGDYGTATDDIKTINIPLEINIENKAEVITKLIEVFHATE